VTPAEPDPVASASAREEGNVGLPRGELRRRAQRGIVIVFTRGVAIALISFAGSVVLARLLNPHAFGLIAFGMAVVLFGSLLADGGLGAGLIRRAEPPAVEELQALTGFQLGVTVGLALVTAAVAAPFGEAGWVTALMVWSLPLAMLQIPGRILLERSLSYRPLATVEVSQVLVYNVWAVSLVLLGFGVWAMASATVVMRVAAMLVMARVIPAGIIRPHFSWRRIRTLLSFGVRFQATNATWLARDQGLNVSLAAVAGVSTLGLWSLANRALQVPSLFIQTLFRVSFPTMSRLVAAKEDVAPLIERAVGMVAVGSGIILTGLVGSAPGLFPGLFGEQWREASQIMPGVCLSIMIAAPVSVSAQGYLYAVGNASAVLRASTFETIALFAATLPLVLVLGVRGIGLGFLIAAVVETYALRRTMLQLTRMDLVRPLLVPVAAFIVSAAAGWLVSDLGGADLASGLVGGACSLVLFVALLTVSRRKLVLQTFRFTVASVRTAARSAPTPTA
jgi:O-antigen/teichoic acid export membrane protein